MSAEQIKNSKDSKSVLLYTKALAKTYQLGKNKVAIFENLTLEIKYGEMIAIVGPSGTGKSTLLHLLGGLDKPTEGSVFMDGFDICKLSDVDLAKVRNKDIGFVFQFHHLLPEFSAVENTMMPLLVGGLTQKESFQLASSILKQVGLGTRLEHRPGELSGGEAARVALARALVTKPKLLLADEPSGNLDSRTGEEIHQLLKQMHSECSLTSVIVTHNERLAAICSRVLHLEDGRLRS
ncbi:MAG: ABC transporter ATP-binding protein [Blastocatellia bacterium]|nr:ABC transporter ATP-binding protein [Blastocatellia bacterium]MBN8723195.1 ABC transporter ATP-binding protein [Acidobacteriota bacterium]